MNITETVKTEKEKLRSMSKKDRRWYIWEYYKFHILLVLAGIILLYTAGAALYRGTFDTVLSCCYLNAHNPELNLSCTEEGFAAYAGLGKKELISVQSGSVSFEEPLSESDYAMLAKITAMAMAHDLDIIIGDTAAVEHYASLNAFADLEELLPPDLSEQLKDRFYYAKDMDGALNAFAVDLAGTAFAAESGLGQNRPLLAITALSDRKDMALTFLRYTVQ